MNINFENENKNIIKHSNSIKIALENYNNLKKNKICWLCKTNKNIISTLNGYSCELCNTKMKYLQWM